LNKYPTELLDVLHMGAILYGLAHATTAVIQTLQDQLDLYHFPFNHRSQDADGVGVVGQIVLQAALARMKTFRVIAVQMTSTAVFLFWMLYV
jgi:hypothetical protein